MKLEVFLDPEALAMGAARHLIDSANAAIQIRGAFRIALAGGSTPKSLYTCLAMHFLNAADWTKVHFYWGDERNVPNDDDQSNFKMSWETLLAPLKISEQNIHRIWTDWDTRVSDPSNAQAPSKDLIVAASEYDSLLKRIPILDFVLLGLGEDGHTASLMPDAKPICPALTVSDQRVVALWIPHLQDFRISMTADYINQAREIAFLVSGAGKAEILSRVMEPGKAIEDVEAHYPAQLIHPASGRMFW